MDKDIIIERCSGCPHVTPNMRWCGVAGVPVRLDERTVRTCPLPDVTAKTFSFVLQPSGDIRLDVSVSCEDKDIHEDDVRRAYFSGERLAALKREMIRMIERSDDPFHVTCAGTDTETVKQHNIFNIKDRHA